MFEFEFYYSKTGKVVLIWDGEVYKIKNLTVNVPCWSKWEEVPHPKLSMIGIADQLTIRGEDAVIV
jgi:hypothetical protein